MKPKKLSLAQLGAIKKFCEDELKSRGMKHEFLSTLEVESASYLPQKGTITIHLKQMVNRPRYVVANLVGTTPPKQLTPDVE